MVDCGCGCKDGDRGPLGEQGVKGDTGSSGPIGIPGSPGPQGIPGVSGIQGAQGIQGVPGIDGSPGPQGPIGPIGPIGATGPQGLQGPAGVDGNDGANGNNGQGRLNYTIDSTVGIHTYNPVLNEGVVMKNTGGLATIELPIGSLIGDVIQVVGTSFGTGGWRIKAAGGDKIQMTSTSAFQYITLANGYVILNATNYRDVITMISDGLGNWIITDSIFANGTIPNFT